jgi:hypothetical protein
MSFPATYNLSIYAGDTYEFVVVPKNSDGSSFSLVGYTAEMNIATSRGSITKTAVQAVVDSVLNIITCTILPGVSGSLSPTTTYVYDVQVTNGSTKIYTLLTGSVSVTEDIS